MISHTKSKRRHLGNDVYLRFTRAVLLPSARSLFATLLLVGLLVIGYASVAPGGALAEGIVVKNYVPAATSFKNGAALALSPGSGPPVGTLGPSCVPETNCARYMSTPLEFHGGRVVRDPQVYLIFWGSNFSHEYEGERWKGHVLNTLGGLTEEYGFNLTYQHILNQYYDSTGPIEGVKLAGDYVYEGVTAPQGQEREDVKGEVEFAITQNKWPREPNSVFVVLHPPGTVYQQGYAEESESGCGYHERDHQGDVFAFVPDLANKYFSAKCGAYSESESGPIYNRIVTFVASHEYSEAVTDPEANAWFDSEGNEIADICAEHGPILVNEALGIWMNGLWGNHEAAEKGTNEGCVVKDPPEPHPPAPSVTTGSATGVEEHSANLEGSVNPDGPDAHYYFEYGTTEAYGSDAPAPPGTDAGFGTVAVAAKTAITGLTPNTKYYYRLVASNWAGTGYGADATFKTPAWAAEAVAPPPTTGAGKLAAVSCLSGTECTAVGRYLNRTGKTESFPPFAETLANHSWSVTAMHSSSPFVELHDGSCSSTTACTAVGQQQKEGPTKALIERWNGSEWKEEESAQYEKTNQAQIVGVACPSAKFCVAVGNDNTSHEGPLALIEQWEGSKWKLASASKVLGELTGVSCPSSTVCTAVGVSNSAEKPMLVEHLASNKWQVESAPTPPDYTYGDQEYGLVGVSCASTTACTAVGGYVDSATKGSVTLAEHWNGTAWSIESTPNELAGGTLRRVSCATATACTAVGHAGNAGFAERLISGKWETETISAPAGSVTTSLSGVSCWTALDCRAAGSYTQTNGAEIPLVEEQELTK